jgi:hypothetical protein
MQMNIIELYSNSDGSLGSNLSSNFKIIVDNILFNEKNQVENLNASVVVYDRYYYNAGSFMTTNGVWNEAKIVVENTSKRLTTGTFKSSATEKASRSDIQRNLLSTISPMSGCMVCTPYMLVGIWYELNTGNIVGYIILDSWEECSETDNIPQGSPPGSTNPTSPITAGTIVLNSPSTPAANKKINNNFTDPCLKSILSSFTSNVQDFVTNAQSDENIYQPMSFSFFGITSLLLDNENGRLVSMDTDADGLNPNFNLAINQNVMPNASQEYILRTYMHEALHGVLLSKGIAWNSFIHHAEIANSYRSLLSYSLRNAFPNLSRSDADALAWEGLAGTPAYEALSNSEKARIRDVTSRHRDHANSGSGTGCN